MRCNDCGIRPRLGVYESAAGWYVGRYCDCGPYSRLSVYYPTKQMAEDVLKSNSYFI